MDSSGFCDFFIIIKSIPNKIKQKILIDTKINKNISQLDKEWRDNVG
jgi:hypothetical protein